MGFSFYSDVDKGSAMPGWTHDEHLNRAEDSIRMKRKALEDGAVPPAMRGQFIEQMKKEEQRLDQIKEDRHRVTKNFDEDKLNRWQEEAGKEISAAMFTYTEMQRGTASAHEEARRMTEPCVRIDPEMAEAAGITLDRKGECSRTDAERAWKLCRKAMGEMDNPEILREEVRRSKSGFKGKPVKQI